MLNPGPSQNRSPLSAALAAFLLTHFAAPSAFALTYYWDNDGATAGFGAAAGTWTAPTTGDSTQGWSQDGTGATLPVNVTTSTSDTLNFGNGTTGLATGTITVSGTVDANKLVVASGSGTITLSGGTIALGGSSPSITANKAGQIISSALTLNANTSVVAGITGNPVLSLNGAIGGTGNLTFTTASVNFSGSATVINLGAASDYSGTTTITCPDTAAAHNNALTVKATVNNALPATTVLSLQGFAGAGGGRQVAYELNGKNQTLAGLTNVAASLRTQRILNSTGTATLTINNTSPASSSFSGNINGTGLSLVKTGTGTQTLSSTNGYTGTTTISGGKLVGVVGGNHSSSDVTVDNAAATYGISITDNTKSWTCKSLATTATGTLEFNFGAVLPSTSVSPLIVTNLADFATTPAVSVLVNAGLLPGTYPLMTWGSTSGTAPAAPNLTMSQLAAGTTASLEVSGNTLNLVISSTAASTVKADNTTNLNDGNSWVGLVAPDATKVAKWNSTVTAPNTTDLGADATWAGIAIENPTGLVTINGTNTLTLGAAAVDIDLSTATADLTLNCPLALNDVNIWDVAATRTLTLGGQVSGAFALTKLGDGTAILSSSANNYNGNTTVSAGTLQLGASNVIPNSIGNGNVVVNGTLDLNGKSEAVNGLSGAGIIDNLAASTTSTLSAGGLGQTSTFSGVIQNSGSTAILNLTKASTGTLTLSGANTFTGITSVTGGTLILGNASALGGTAGITLAGGTRLTPSLSGINISAPITLGATGTTATITAPDVAGSGTNNFPVTLSGGIGGAGNVTFSGISSTNAYGVINLNAACSYAGSTLITTASTTGNDNAAIFFKLGVADALPVTTVVTLDGGNGTGSLPGRYCELDLNGNNQTLAGLTNVTGRTLRIQRVVNSGGAATLTVNNSADYTYSGQLGFVSGQYGSTAYNNFGLTKSGTASMTLAGTGNYTGATTISDGKLFINGNQTGASGTVTVNAGATLGGTGTIGGDTSISNTGKLEFDINTDAASHNKLDLATGKTLTFSGVSTLTITSSGGTPAPGLYTLVTAPGGISGSVPATVILPPGWTADAPAITGVGNTDLVINITSISSGAPEIAVDQGGDIASGNVTPKDFGTVTLGSNNSLVFTINNTGTAALNLTGSPSLVAVSGTNASDFTVTSAPASSVSAGGNTTFTVQFAPSGSGVRNAVLTIANNDSDEGSFTINISGTGQTAYDAWAGGALFNQDANGDGVKNGLAWILGAANPNASATGLLPTVSTSGGNMVFTFKRNQASINANTALTIEVGTTLASWPSVYTVGADTAGSTAGVTVTKDTPGAGTDTITLSVTQSPDAKKFARLKAVQTP